MVFIIVLDTLDVTDRNRIPFFSFEIFPIGNLVQIKISKQPPDGPLIYIVANKITVKLFWDKPPFIPNTRLFARKAQKNINWEFIIKPT